ncbi:unnamed protein product [Caenorhabditis auriculariae]|uniref:G-protein coupled receptors family 1 profile domain-containing protein n=1 Tax=Caenorhabditis auriculariae TaxID=2777116 RepID=A0A8S1GV39_9PELO|nr:unnamed protein product [Caenorhabditis auriculariae]
MLLEMSMKMGSKQSTNNVREIAARRANRQQQRILLQITVVALIFYGYMTAYYISYYSRWFQSTAAMIFNSYFYSTTHMINPVIYFSLNKEMRAQFREAMKDFIGMFRCGKKDPYGFANSSTKINHSTKATNEVAPRSTSCSETSPLFSINNHYKSTCDGGGSREQNLSGDSSSSPGSESAEIRAIVDSASNNAPSHCSLPHSDLYSTPLDELPLNKMNARERSAFISQLVAALQYSSSKSLSKMSSFCEVRRGIDKSATTNDISQAAKQRYIRFSNTVQFISREPLGKDHLLPTNSTKYSSMDTLDRTKLNFDTLFDRPDFNASPVLSRSSSSSNAVHRSSGYRNLQDNSFFDKNVSSDEDIAYL